MFYGNESFHEENAMKLIITEDKMKFICVRNIFIVFQIIWRNLILV